MSSEEVEKNISSTESFLTRASKRIAENFMVSAANEKLRDLDAHFVSDEDKEKVELLIASMIIDAEKLKCRYSDTKKDLMESVKTVDELTDKITEEQKSLEHSKSSEKALAERIEEQESDEYLIHGAAHVVRRELNSEEVQKNITAETEVVKSGNRILEGVTAQSSIESIFGNDVALKTLELFNEILEKEDVMETSSSWFAEDKDSNLRSLLQYTMIACALKAIYPF